MSFELISEPAPTAPIEVPISSIEGFKGDLLELAIGATTWTEATSGSQNWSRKAVVQSPYTTADTVALAVPVNLQQKYRVESANASDDSDNGDRMLLTDENTVNNTGTDNTSEEACFIQDGVSGASATNRIVGRIMSGNGVDPAAT